MLAIIQFTGIKRILVGLRGISVCTRFKEQLYAWDELKAAVVEFDPDPRVDFLRLKIFGNGESNEPLLNLDISRAKSVVKARRHFLKNVLTHVDTICYVTRTQADVRVGAAKADDLAPEAKELPPRAG